MIFNHPILKETMTQTIIYVNPIMQNHFFKHQMFETIQSHPCRPVDLQRILCNKLQNRLVDAL